MSTISVYFINGSKGSVCRNDAYSVVRTADGENQLLDIIPASDLTDDKIDSLSTVYETAVNDSNTKNVDQVKRTARAALGLQL